MLALSVPSCADYHVSFWRDRRLNRGRGRPTPKAGLSVLWDGRADDKGKQERERRDERTEWYGVRKEVKPVCAEFTVPLHTRLCCEVCKRRLNAYSDETGS